MPADRDCENEDTGEVEKPAAVATVSAPAADEAEPVLQVYSAGPTTVVGFGGRDVLDNVNLALCRQELLDLIKEHEAKAVAFDLTGVILMPSGLLGLLASLKQEGVEVHVYNPSDDVREVLGVTHLDKVLQVREVDVPETAVT